MPKLSAPKPDVKRFFLPSTKNLPEAEQAYVDLNIGKLTTGDLAGVDDDGGKVEMTAAVLAGRIQGWNFTEEDGVTPMPVTLKAIMMFNIDDFIYLNSQFENVIENGLSTAQKKS